MRLARRAAVYVFVLLEAVVLWSVALTHFLPSPAPAAWARGEWLLRAEHSLRLPSELALASWTLAHPAVAELLDVWYGWAHFLAAGLVLAWLVVKHPKVAPRVLVLFAAFVSLAAAVQVLVPMAPPRLLPGGVDVALRLGGSVYGARVVPDDLTAMPSVHVGFAAVVCLCLWRLLPRSWRWTGPAYAAVTWASVLLTGNHFWLDGLAADGLVLGLAGLLWRRNASALVGGFGYALGRVARGRPGAVPAAVWLGRGGGAGGRPLAGLSAPEA